jgi:penicillin amidase
MRELEDRLGSDISAWRWGNVHRLTFRHPLADLAPGDARFVAGPFEVPGTGQVINNLGFARGSRFDVVSGPDCRMVVDFADLDRTGAVLALGQSGQPGSPRATDHLDKWLAGELFAIPFSRGAVDAASVGRTRITPRTADA